MEADKLRALRDTIQTKLDYTECRLAFESAGVVGELVFSGPEAQEMRRFAARYLRPFPLSRPGQEPDFSVLYTSGAGELAAGEHPFWNELQPEFRLSAQSDGTTTVLQRDFVGLLERDSRRLIAVGPVLDERTTDTLDNILLLMFSRKLVERGALATHAATIERKGMAYVFFGASGAGKSTIARHCFDADGLRVLSGDQIYLRPGTAGLMAHPAPSTIPEFPRGHDGWCSEPRPVRALIHLVQRPGAFAFRRFSVAGLLPHFLRETIYLPEFRDAGALLDIVSSALESPRVTLGEMSYPLGTSFWASLDEHLNKGADT